MEEIDIHTYIQCTYIGREQLYVSTLGHTVFIGGIHISWCVKYCYTVSVNITRLFSPDTLQYSGPVLCSFHSDLLQSKVLVLPLHSSPSQQQQQETNK